MAKPAATEKNDDDLNTAGRPTHYGHVEVTIVAQCDSSLVDICILLYTNGNCIVQEYHVQLCMHIICMTHRREGGRERERVGREGRRGKREVVGE